MRDRNPQPSSEALALINARLVDPASRLDQRGGVLIRDGLIADFGPYIDAGAAGDAEIVDCAGLLLAPGLVDMMVFAGEPGHEHRETLATASSAASAGGVTTIACRPHTDPVIDDVALVDFILRRARDTALGNVHPLAATTKGLLGEEMTEIGLLREAGAIAFLRYQHAINSTSLIERLRDEAGVLVVPGDHFEMDGYLRIGFGSDPSHLVGSLERIGALLDTIPAGASIDAR